MKKFIVFVILISLLSSTAFASGTDYSHIFTDELNFNIFRYVVSKFVRTNSQDESSVPDTDTKPQESKTEDKQTTADKEKKPSTMRNVAASMCVARKVSKAIVNGDDVLKVEYSAGTSGKIYECYFSYKSYTKNSMFTYEDISEGSIFYINAGSDGFVSNYTVVAVINKSTKQFSVDVNAVKSNFNSRKVSCTYSYITDINYRNGKTSISLGNGEDLVIDDDAAQFTYHNNGRNSDVYSGDFTKYNVDVPEYDEDNDVSEVYFVFAVNYEGETVAICSVTTPSYVSGNIED